MAIDTLAFVKALEAAGVPREQAEAHVSALGQHALADLATKGDVALLKSDLAAVRAEMVTKGDLKADLAELKYELTWRLFGLMLGVVGIMNSVLFALLKLVH